MGSSTILASAVEPSKIGKTENDEKKYVIPKPDPDVKPFKEEDFAMGSTTTSCVPPDPAQVIENQLSRDANDDGELAGDLSMDVDESDLPLSNPRISSVPTIDLGPNRTMDGDLATVDERIAGPVVKPEPRDIELGPMPFENVEDGPKPTTFRRVFMEAVVVPTLASVLRRDDEEIQKKQEKLHNPKVKKMKNLAMSMDSVHLRLRDIGYDLYPIPLAKDIQDVTVTRQFISCHYGGNTQATFPSIKQSFLDKHGLNDFMYPNLEYNPHAPEVPGAPGLFFGAIGGPAGEWDDEQRVICRIKQSEWQYQGQYVFAPVESLTKEEWCSQKTSVRNTWANQICIKDWGRITRARITLRQQLKREPTPEEIDEALDTENKYFNVTPEQVGRAFTKGEECLAVWTMKCVGYDTGFQQNLAEKLPGWVPPPPKPKKAKNDRPHRSKRKLTKQGPGSEPRGRKRKREESVSASDHEEVDYGEEASVVDEPVYRPRGTRSRPTFL